MNTTSDAPGTLEGFDARDEETGAERLAERAHKTIDDAAEKAAHAEREIRRAAGDAVDRIRRSEAEVADMVDQNLRKVRDYIERNPVQSAAIAFAAGVVLSGLFRR